MERVFQLHNAVPQRVLGGMLPLFVARFLGLTCRRALFANLCARADSRYGLEFFVIPKAIVPIDIGPGRVPALIVMLARAELGVAGGVSFLGDFEYVFVAERMPFVIAPILCMQVRYMYACMLHACIDELAALNAIFIVTWAGPLMPISPGIK